MKKSDVVAYFGSQRKVANRLGISHVAVSRWDEEIPELRARQLEELTGGKLKREPRSDDPTIAA
jgi:DNA-binding transcriptional regulator YdaS (Cro superfamily)